MQKNIRLVLTPKQAASESDYISFIANELNIKSSRISAVRPLKKSIDARSKLVKIIMEFEVCWDQKTPEEIPFKPAYQYVGNKPEVHIIGAGPAGLFAALRLIEFGLKPVIFERGKEVRGRRRDIADINRKHIVNPNRIIVLAREVPVPFLMVNYIPDQKKEAMCKEFLKSLHITVLIKNNL
jgi:uncharacterized protein